MEKPKQVLLATALVNAESQTGEFQVIRALLDQGSQACFITEATVQLLRLKKRSIHGVISGLGDNKSVTTKYEVNFTIQSRFDPMHKIPIKAFVLKNITSYLPEKHIKSINWIDLQYLPLADPGFTASGKIDLLISAEVYSYILKEGLMRSPTGSLIAQNTTLGWIVSGVVDTANVTEENNNKSKAISRNITVMHAQVNEDDILRKFWEIEEQLPDKRTILTEEEQRCEDFFTSTTVRTPEGRYIVRLPFREDQPQCTNHGSRDIAEARFRSLEKRFAKDKHLKEKYTEVINEYLTLDHMRPANENIKENEATYLPHHAVVRDDKTTTKVRVVFNASEKNKKGVSLNDTLMIGPTIQADLRHTVMRWREHPIALVADIVKMYRQVLVAEEDVKYQRILWRDEPEKQIKEYELLTVTFGTASAPYLAVRVLQQIAMDEGQEVPQAAERILQSFYMDDLMTGCSSAEEGVELYNQLSKILEKGGFKLQKWNSNDKTLVETIKEMERESDGLVTEEVIEGIKDSSNTQETELKLKLDQTVKILGLTWNRDDDFLQYSVILPPATAPVTKRTIIGDIARLFDPLGWIAPTIIIAKIFIQRLWIPRWLGTCPDDVQVELHGFCDASKAAYSAVIYLRTINIQGQVNVSLLTAKTRVAPIKQVSIPKLELCGAVLLSRLITETAKVLNIPKDKVKAWTDSTIVLAWLNAHPSKWKTYVANRTSEILTNMNSSQWSHISTKHNPADLASRGVLPVPLAESSLWFKGPQIIQEQITYPRATDLKGTLEESAGRTYVATIPDDTIFKRFSSLSKLLRVVAYCRRFIRRTRSTYLRKDEIDEALQCCIRQAQRESFPSEYAQLLVGNSEHKLSSLRSLCPYLDDNKIIRVTGRLQKAQGDENFKHPIILPKNHQLTKLIVADAHERTLHGGPQLMINYLRSAYWIISVRTIVRQHVHACVICAKQKAQTKAQFMGSLPSVRCTPARPFLHSGLDYAGPINIRTSKGRGHRSYKGYISLFVCMSTRAIHLELVSDMTSQAFLAAFKRFTARRGHCTDIWSDNGTTFVGASKELQQLSSIQEHIVQNLEMNGTTWHFIPPHAPNFGGIWEAGVKSTKFHLKRMALYVINSRK
ncbi:uncharacterized protein LOC135080214 [Ostrinia nubilalis]|uniref:uncharacterized protein LOC135080214 n=1 Tax=Ostrinia nubilalis TaxID=29057 RepID=UPI0030826356